MYAEISRTGAAAVRRASKKNPMQVLVDIIEGDPTADGPRLFRLWWATVKEDDEQLEAIARHAFTNFLSSLERDRRQTRRAKPRAQHAQERRAVAKLVEQIKGVVLMDLMLPNGKKLRDSTFAQCSAAGGWFKVLATKGRPSEIVGKKLTEADLHKLRP